MPNIHPELQKRIASATKDLSIAEKELEVVLEAIEHTERAEKRIIGPALQDAFAKVVAAKTALAAVLEDHAS